MMSKSIRIGNLQVGQSHPPFIVAEMSGNHNNSLDRAFEIVDAAAAAGAHGFKLQTYTADTMTIDCTHGEFTITDKKSLWAGKSLYRLYEEAHTPWEWHKPILDRCREKGMIGFSTPFDNTAVDFLESLNVAVYKVASFELTDLQLISKIASTKKPIIMSTGMATVAEIDNAVRAAKRAGCQDLILLQCTSSYPASPENSNLMTIPHMRDLFGVEAGLSDHTMGCGAAIASVALGGCMVEKHFTLRRADGGVDSAFSLEPEEMKTLVVESERAWRSLGKVTYGPNDQEKPSLQFRRSLYIVKDMKAGDTLSPENVRAIRPGMGLPPSYYDVVMGKKLKADAKRGTAVSWDLI